MQVRVSMDSTHTQAETMPDVSTMVAGMEEMTPSQAHAVVNRAIRDGLLERPARCSRCNNIPIGPIQAHHEDYSQPLNILWLCNSCHHVLHSKPWLTEI